MSEPMKPGRELDKLVAEAMGQTDFSHPRFSWSEIPLEDGDGWDGWICPRCWTGEENKESPCVKMYSTDIRAAMMAWEWLENNNPWQPISTDPGDIYLSRYWINGKPAVIVIRVAEAEIVDFRPNLPLGRYNFAIYGESYPHAIALAVVAAGAANDV